MARSWSPVAVLAVAGLLLLSGLAAASAAAPASPAIAAPTGAVESARPAGPPPAGPTVEIAPGFSPGPTDRLLGPLPPTTPLEVDVGLAPSDPSGFASRVAAEYLPGTSLYRDYLTPSAFAAQYGPAPTGVAAATAYFRSYGLSVSVSPDDLLLTVTGSAQGLGAAFHTSFAEYRSPQRGLFFSHPGAAELPSIAPWSGAVGLGNVTPIVPAAAAAAPAAAPPAAGCPGASVPLEPCAVWGAYDMAGTIANGTDGAGTTIAIVDTYDDAETQSALASDLAGFDAQFDLPSPAVTYAYPVPTSVDLNATSTGWGLEEVLDLEWAHASAPGASLLMTFAPNSGAGLYAAVDWLVAHPTANVISLSWGEPDVGVFNAFDTPCASACNASSDGSYAVLAPVLELAAAEGITVFAASGDCGAADGTSGLATNFPASDPYVTGVGGTVLTVDSNAAWSSETAWSGNASGASSPGCENQGGSGGGFAPFPRPAWQTGPGLPPAPATRGVPDVSLDAGTPVVLVRGGEDVAVEGTSVATPIWAGIASLADNASGEPLGFLDPSLYGVLRGAAYASSFHDITAGSNGYAAGPGWDPVTGIGTPIVGALLPELARSVPPTSNLTAHLLASSASGPVPLAVHFSVLAAGGSGTYPLEGIAFGDGNATPAGAGAVAHPYEAAGVYPAQGYVEDSGGNFSVSPPVAVVAGGGRVINVTVTASATTAAPGATVTLTATATGGTAPYSYFWFYGDGTILNWSSARSTTHAYAVAGTDCAAVVVADAAAPVDGAASAPVALGIGGPATSACTFSVAPLTVTATPDVGVRDAPADFPDLFAVGGGPSPGSGSPVTTTWNSSDPYVAACGCAIFRAAGSFSVQLTADDSLGQEASAETNVTVAPPLAATFAASTQRGPVPLTVDFTAAVTGGDQASAANTTWTFGDGAVASGATVSATYPSPGWYVAVAHVADQGHGNASEAFLIDAVAAGASGPELTATVDPAVDVPAGTPVAYTAAAWSAGGAPLEGAFDWALGNGSGGYAPNVNATYPGPGPGGAVAANDSISVTIPSTGASVGATIRLASFGAVEAGGFVPRADALEANVTGSPAAGFAPLLWSGTVSAGGPGGTAVAWSFGDGSGSSSSAPAHVFAAGSFTVVARVTDAWGDVATADLPVRAAEAGPLVVAGGPSVRSGGAPLAVAFALTISGGVGPPYTTLWTFGDGTYSPAANASHTYAAGGQYVASVTVQDARGHTFAQNWTIDVTGGSPGGPSGGPFPGPALLLLVAAGAGVAVAIGGAVLAGGRRRRARPPPSP